MSAIDQLKEKLTQYERALEEEVWSSKLGKFIPFKEMPSVRKILEGSPQKTEEENK